jgi:Fur family transcriptional regulator, ferric uptake regulator
MKKELYVFQDFVRTKGLRHTRQRAVILDIFLRTEGHVSLEELHRLVRRRHPSIGFTTVYRTMRLLSESGLCGEIDFGDGISRFEHKYDHRHHDHLVCIRCGGLTEVVSQQIEELQERMARQHGFNPTRHKLEIFGICRRCRGKG